MMKEDSISNLQLIYLVILTQIGTRVLILPYDEAKYAGNHGWLAVLLGGFAAQIGIMLIWWLGKRYPTQNIFQYLQSSVGRPIGAALTLLYALYFTYSACVVTLIYLEILNRWVMVKTPWWVLLLLFLLASGYAAMSSLRVLTFISQSLVSILVVSYLLVLFSGIKQSEFSNLLPLWQHTQGSSFVQGIFQGFSACLGYDLLLYAFPYVRGHSNKKILGAMTWANGLTTLYYFTVVLICSLSFTPEQLSIVPEPIVFILKQYDWQLFQSIDIVFIVFWFTILSATVYVYLFLAGKAMSHIGKGHKGNHVRWVIIITVICYAIGIWFPDKKVITLIGGTPYRISSIMCVVAIPLLLLIVSHISSLRRRHA
ncbi:GerAB/ArcD/ProY family transporter [Paenibacillus qinlingensis]|uniref:Spore germination protein (Amino acid permease) n=1 Tax=Paenibacillus qinlingensis TaxID=1837343 RepID=A0ABU1NT45_9BACL|nr:GerAB/ArcD/ProY family transporter [Paenibacillus qinlingensis]MDR6550625.1 spore germination protein (amino acid permease) [Paenibacillus qinlingensis]